VAGLLLDGPCHARKASIGLEDLTRARLTDRGLFLFLWKIPRLVGQVEAVVMIRNDVN